MVKNNKRIGMTTSGGYGHNVEKSLAMAFVEPEFSEPGIELKTHIVEKKSAVWCLVIVLGILRDRECVCSKCYTGICLLFFTSFKDMLEDIPVNWISDIICC